MAKLLGTDRFLVLGEAAKRRGESDERESGYLARDIESLKLKLEGREQTTEATVKQSQRRSLSAKKSRKLKEILDELTKRLNVLEGVAADRTRAEQDVTRIQQEITQLENRRNDHPGRDSTIDHRLHKRAELELTASERNAYETQIETARTEAERIRTEKLKLESLLNELRSGYREITQEWERERDRKQSALKQAVMEAEARFNRLDNEFQSKRRELETRKRTLEQKAKLLESGEFTAELCQTCPFTRTHSLPKPSYSKYPKNSDS